MLKSKLLFVFIICAVILKAQDSSKVILSGSIKDSETGEGLIGATVLAKSGVGAIADLDGNFILKLNKGEYNIEISMLGYRKYSQKIKLYSNKKIDVKLENTTLDEVEVVANVAQIRETPVAFSSISSTKIQEELGGKDISMIANTTPGAYATSQGGGAGDSRVTIRGFDQRNIGVLVDGIPVNDMESGQVYWSNWDGLKDITKSMQIQRGLGASKLAISSIGGTMNFITTGIEGKQQLVVKKEWANNRGNVMSLAYNSGLINNKWGITLAGTYRNGDGWAQQTWYSAYSYFVKVQFMPNPRHIISLGVNGAPQSHGSRSSKVPIAVYDREYSAKLGVPQDTTLWKNGINGLGYTTETQGDRDLRWSADQGVLDKATLFNDKINVFHKPLFNLNHFWKISEKTTLSTVVYASLGTGGGTGLYSSLTTRDTLTGYYVKLSPPTNPQNVSFHPGEKRSTNFIRMQNNDHKWVGALSTATSKLSKQFTLTYGIDLRYYIGHHYNTIYNLLGGDYYEESGTNKNPNIDYQDRELHVKRKNDIYGANWKSTVKWAGLFGQVEFKKDKWSAFFTATGSKSAYNRVDYYRKKDLVIDGHTFQQAIQYGETLYWNGDQQVLAQRQSTITTNGDTTFIKNPGSTSKTPILNATGYDINSKEARDANTGWVYQIGYTIKGGANYNINDHHNVFVNIGVMQIPQRLDNTFNFSNYVINGFKPQYIQSYEAGYGIKYNRFYGSFNAYYTSWQNQPQASRTDPNTGALYVSNGIDVIYKGVEFEGIYKPIKQIELEGVLSFGDWRYNSGSEIYAYNSDNVIVTSLTYDAKGVHVGNAAQNQVGLGIRYMPFKGLYIKPRFTRFDKNYAGFNAMDLNNKPDATGKIIDNRGRESWKLPAYYLIDFSAGYDLPFKAFKLNIYTTVNNILNLRYITDAQNNGAFQNSSGFNAASASVFFGVGRTYTIGTKLTF